MRKFPAKRLSLNGAIAVATAISLMAPVLMAPAANAKSHRNHSYKEWQGRDGRTYCRKKDGTTGLVIGAVGGALAGRMIDTRGDRTLGTLAGAAAGGLVGKKIDSGTTCK